MRQQSRREGQFGSVRLLTLRIHPYLSRVTFGRFRDVIRHSARSWHRITTYVLSGLRSTKAAAAIEPRIRQVCTVGIRLHGQIRACAVRFIETGTQTEKNAVAAGAVAAVHVALVLLMLVGLHVRDFVKPNELQITLGGPIGAASLPKFLSPKLPTVQPPLVTTEETFQANITEAQGSPNVTAPAEAIAAEHQFPALPAAFKDGGLKQVRLLLSVTENGAVAGASILQSCGIEDLDALAVTWVKSHWRYRPAIQNGVTIAVTTTAVVVFSST